MMMNMRPTSIFMTISKVSYLLNHTKTKPKIPAMIAQARRGSSGNRAVRGRAVALMAVAP